MLLNVIQLLNGKFTPDIEDVKAIAKPILRHRIVKNYKAEAKGMSIDDIIEAILIDMILPIVAYGSDVLRKECVEIDNSYSNLDQLIDNMFETMNAASGVGLAAPQINKSIRLFIIDTTPFNDEINPDHVICKKVFINPKIISRILVNPGLLTKVV